MSQWRNVLPRSGGQASDQGEAMTVLRLFQAIEKSSEALHYNQYPIMRVHEKRVMSTRKPWDFALHIKGVSLDSLDMARLADYMKAFADLIGDASSPKLVSIVKGSVVMRVRDCGEHPAIARQRIRDAEDDDTPGNTSYQKLISLMHKDGARGSIIDRDRNVLLAFTPTRAANDESKEYILHDNGELDGVVVGIAGKDDTVHVRLQALDDTVHSVTVRDMVLARELAVRFRYGTVRVHVHGTWKRRADGIWEPNVVYADRIEDLDQASALDVFKELAVIPNNGWNTLDDAGELWRKIRGLDDRSH